MELSPLKRALRNSLLISLVVGGVVSFQGQPPLNSLLTALFTFAVTFPALWLSFRYTQSLLEKYKTPPISEQDEAIAKGEATKSETTPKPEDEHRS